MIEKNYFRGKTNSNKWVYGSLIQLGLEQPKIVFIKRTHPNDNRVLETDWVYVKPETVGQFTGLCDKSKDKRPIYHGDILKHAFSEKPFGMVEWHPHGYWFIKCTASPYAMVEDHKSLGEMLEVTIDGKEPELTVIGNRFDNPELFELLQFPHEEVEAAHLCVVAEENENALQYYKPKGPMPRRFA